MTMLFPQPELNNVIVLKNKNNRLKEDSRFINNDHLFKRDLDIIPPHDKIKKFILMNTLNHEFIDSKVKKIYFDKHLLGEISDNNPLNCSFYHEVEKYDMLPSCNLFVRNYGHIVDNSDLFRFSTVHKQDLSYNLSEPNNYKEDMEH